MFARKRPSTCATGWRPFELIAGQADQRRVEREHDDACPGQPPGQPVVAVAQPLEIAFADFARPDFVFA